MEKLKAALRKWLDVPTVFIEPNGDIWIQAQEEVSKLRERVEDLEEAYPGYQKAKEAADKKPEPLIQGFMPFSQRKKHFEASRRKGAEKK